MAGGGRGGGAWKSKLWPLYQMLCPVPATSSLPSFMSPAQNKCQLVSGPAARPALAVLVVLSRGKSGLPKEAWVTGWEVGGIAKVSPQPGSSNSLSRHNPPQLPPLNEGASPTR